jgi:hypothetical protein
MRHGVDSMKNANLNEIDISINNIFIDVDPMIEAALVAGVNQADIQYNPDHSITIRKKGVEILASMLHGALESRTFSLLMAMLTAERARGAVEDAISDDLADADIAVVEAEYELALAKLAAIRAMAA